VELVSRARERGGKFYNNSQKERAIEVGFGSERFEQPLQRRGRGWCEFVNPFGQVNWKNVGQLVGTN